MFFLSNLIYSKMLEELTILTHKPNHILVLGLPNGNIENIKQQIKSIYKHQFELTYIENLTHMTICQKFDLIIDTCSINYYHDPINITSVFLTIKQILNHKGLYIGYFFGIDTLSALQDLLEQNNINFFDFHNIGDILLNINMVNPVLSQEHILLSYKTAKCFVQDFSEINFKLNLSKISELKFPIEATIELSFVCAEKLNDKTNSFKDKNNKIYFSVDDIKIIE